MQLSRPVRASGEHMRHGIAEDAQTGWAVVLDGAKRFEDRVARADWIPSRDRSSGPTFVSVHVQTPVRSRPARSPAHYPGDKWGCAVPCAPRTARTKQERCRGDDLRARDLVTFLSIRHGHENEVPGALHEPFRQGRDGRRRLLRDGVAQAKAHERAPRPRPVDDGSGTPDRLPSSTHRLTCR